MNQQVYEDFGPYRLECLLGQGGAGEVWAATDRVTMRRVALKRLHPHRADDTAHRRRFQREAKLAARLTNPHVIPIHRFGEQDGRLFLDMRLIDGIDLEQMLISGGRCLPTARSRSWARSRAR